MMWDHTTYTWCHCKKMISLRSVFQVCKQSGYTWWTRGIDIHMLQLTDLSFHRKYTDNYFFRKQTTTNMFVRPKWSLIVQNLRLWIFFFFLQNFQIIIHVIRAGVLYLFCVYNSTADCTVAILFNKREDNHYCGLLHTLATIYLYR